MSEETPTGADLPETDDAAVAAADAPDANSSASSEKDDGVQVEIVDEGPCQKRIKFVVSSERVSEELDTNYKQLRGTIQLPGFRKGKVPLSIIKGRFGSKIEDEVKEDMVNSTFFDAIESHELKVIGTPSFENIVFSPGDPLTYEAAVELAPTFEIPNYVGLEIDAQPVSVGADEVTKEIDEILEQQTRLEPIEAGEQKKDDFAVCHVSIVDSEGNDVFDRDEVHLKIGLDEVDNIEVPGLGDALIGSAVEQTHEFSLDAPDDFPLEEVRGQKVTLRVRFLDAKRAVKPELNEETLGQLGVASEEELRSEIEKNLETRRRVEEETRQEQELVDTMLESVTLEFPQSLLERRAEEVSMSARFRMMREGKEKEEVEAELTSRREEFEKEARAELTRYFVLDAIADKETVLVTEEEIARRITAIAMSTGRQPPEVLEEYRENGMIDELRSSLRREKVREVIRKKAKVNKPAGAEENASEDSAGNPE